MSENLNIPEIYGSSVFGDKEMRARLPKELITIPENPDYNAVLEQVDIIRLRMHQIMKVEIICHGRERASR